MNRTSFIIALGIAVWGLNGSAGMAGENWYTPYDGPRMKRVEQFEFTQTPKARNIGHDKYEITFAVKANCDVTVGLVDQKGIVIRHLASGVLGPNAPLPFQKSSLSQKLFWDGKDDLDNYIKEPKKIRVRVMLGLKPELERILGWHPKQFPGSIIAVGADHSGVFVISGGGGQGWRIRAFDHEGNYSRTTLPPPANMPHEKLGGMGFVEYEPGKRTVHAAEVRVSVSDRSNYLPTFPFQSLNIQPALIKNRIYYGNDGSRTKAYLFYVNTDGSTDSAGVAGFPWTATGGAKTATHPKPRLAASPDKKWLYLSGLINGRSSLNYVLRFPVDNPLKGTVFWGQAQPGTGDRELHQPDGIACDSKGNLYICDAFNSRLQVVSPNGKLLKSLPIKRPRWVQIHPKTDAVYVFHQGTHRGKSLMRVIKFASYQSASPEWTVDMPGASADKSLFCLDGWGKRTRIWVTKNTNHNRKSPGWRDGMFIYEEQGATLKLVQDFTKLAAKEMGHPNLMAAGKHDKLVCDASSETLYYKSRIGPVRFDLSTGKFIDRIKLPGRTDDFAFDRRGFMHCHFNPGFYVQGVGRVDVTRKNEGHYKFGSFTETPYDYGVAKTGSRNEAWKGILPTRCQPGAKWFQDGLGVNMRGDVVVESNIYYAPKIEDQSEKSATFRDNSAFWVSTREKYAHFKKTIKAMQKRGEEVFFIPKKAGWPGHGGTAWVFDHTGEMRQECAVVGGRLVNGVSIDQEGHLYAAFDSRKMVGGKPFLAGHGGTFGKPHPLYEKSNKNPFITTYMKTSTTGAQLLIKRAPIKMEPWPDRPKDINKGWVTGAEWLYAGTGPIVCVTCSCPSMRSHLDWYKRSFIPEAYRHSFGVLDSNGNLILHMGQYGNGDSGQGPNSPIKVGGDEIALSYGPYISGTDNRVCFNDYSRLVVARLSYHEEKIVAISFK